MLIDGGGLRGYGSDPAVTFDVGDRIVAPFLRRQGIRRLEVVVMTHPHEDHVGGLGATVEQIPVGLVLENGDTADSPAYARFERAIQAKRIPRRIVSQGDVFRLGRDVEVEVVGPQPPPFRETHSDLNNDSIVLRLRYRKFVALFTGDIEAEAEARLLPSFGPADLLKVAHHGSRVSTSEAFVERVHPKIALVGVGEHNTFGHPNPEVVRRLERHGARVYRTDRNGAITVETDGERIRATTFLGDTASRLPGVPSYR
jgi:competence protein ComEC